MGAEAARIATLVAWIRKLSAFLVEAPARVHVPLLVQALVAASRASGLWLTNLAPPRPDDIRSVKVALATTG